MRGNDGLSRFFPSPHESMSAAFNLPAPVYGAQQRASRPRLFPHDIDELRHQRRLVFRPPSERNLHDRKRGKERAEDNARHHVTPAERKQRNAESGRNQPENRRGMVGFVAHIQSKAVAMIQPAHRIVENRRALAFE